ncbi:MAG: GNAT family N-acetyltransferase [Clostridia bacterium]|nr:GNAT family N-acetyltransferase [Clostridia bacterium]
MTYQRIVNISDTDIPHLTSILKQPEIAKFISIDENNYWNYVTQTENVFYFKVFDNDILVAATHCEIHNKTLYMDIMVIPQYQRKGIATLILRDILFGKLQLDFDKIEVSIDEQNTPSIKLFEKMNFIFVSKEDDLLNYTYYSTKENT